MHSFLIIIQLPREYGIVETYDLFFKVHKVLNLSFNPVIYNMMNFVQTFIYKLEDGQRKPSNSMKAVYNDLI